MSWLIVPSLSLSLRRCLPRSPFFLQLCSGNLPGCSSTFSEVQAPVKISALQSACPSPALGIYRCYVLNPNKLKMSVSPDWFTHKVAVKMRSADLSRMWHDSSVANVFPYWTNPGSNYSVIDSLKATGQQNRFREEGSRSSLDHAGGVGPRWLQQWTWGRCLNFSTEDFHAIIYTRVQLQHTRSHSQWWLFPVKFSEKNCLNIVLAQV